MLVIRFEMWPSGDEARKYAHGEIRIANVSEGNGRSHAAAFSDYEVVLFKVPRLCRNPQGLAADRSPGVWKRGRIQAFPRKRLGPYDLLLRCLVAAIPFARNPEASNAAGRADLGDTGETP